MKESIRVRAQALLQRVKTNKRLVLCVAAGLLALALVCSLDFSKSEAKKTEAPPAELAQTQLREELAALLSRIRGAGAAEVMITFDAGTETVYAADRDAQSEAKAAETDSDREKTSYVILKNGSSETGLQLKEIYPKVRGVAVVCEGGANAVIKAQIIQTVTALFDIKSTNVSVAEMAAKEEPT